MVGGGLAPPGPPVESPLAQTTSVRSYQQGNFSVVLKFQVVFLLMFGRSTLFVVSL